EPERTRDVLTERDDELVLQQRRETGTPDDQPRVLRARRRARVEQVPLRIWNLPVYSHPCSRYQATDRRTPSFNVTAGANPSSRCAREMSNARLFVKKSTRRR